MADFQSSTHRSKWIFTPEELDTKRRIANERAKELLEKFGSTLMEVDIDGSLSFPKSQVATQDSAEKRSRLKPLSIDEEQLMMAFYHSKIQEVCNNFYFPPKIQAVALIYFKRFYLQWSIMEHHPKHIMLTCIYAACKIEDNHVSAEEIGRGISQDHQMILNSEMIIYQSLEFDLIVYTPYRSVDGFLNDIEEFCHVDDDKIQMLKETARVEVKKIMLTDAPLMFPPGQLALAALHNSNARCQVIDFESYLRSLLSRQTSGHTVFELIKSLDEIDSCVKACKTPSEKELKHINKKLRSCVGSHDESKKREKKSKDRSKESK